MKKLVMVLFLASVAVLGADEKKTEIRYNHILGLDGSVLATIDSETGNVDYKKSCEDVTPVLISRIAAVVTACNNELAKLKSEPPKAKKKK